MHMPLALLMQNWGRRITCPSLTSHHAYSLRLDSDPQTNAHSKTPYDTEAAPESATEDERSELIIR